MMSLEERHGLERKFEQELKITNPQHPALKKIYYSTNAALNAYYKALFGQSEAVSLVQRLMAK